ncbi:hypothetical protein CDL12_00941 [Handroanthus impetiginosus]|uniref:DUF4283 domain-containing protein n=1 Tax=Handroanthus impetiginosus TaxID=429701 RepID=A0A2G9I974_9LAMI|nr:hypothetical protein CDL12_00941 [Handroanthus impetiginosus]
MKEASTFILTHPVEGNVRSNVQVNELEKNTLVFIFQVITDMEKVLKQAPWNFRGCLIVLTPWPDELAFQDLNFEEANFWIQASNIPVKYTNQVTAKTIGNKIGKFLFADIGLEHQKWSKHLIIKVQLSISEPLIQEISHYFSPNHRSTLKI